MLQVSLIATVDDSGTSGDLILYTANLAPGVRQPTAPLPQNQRNIDCYFEGNLAFGGAEDGDSGDFNFIRAHYL